MYRCWIALQATEKSILERQRVRRQQFVLRVPLVAYGAEFENPWAFMKRVAEWARVKAYVRRGKETIKHFARRPNSFDHVIRARFESVSDEVSLATNAASYVTTERGKRGVRVRCVGEQSPQR